MAERPPLMAAYDEMLERCSSGWAPWHVIPSNRKSFRNLAVAEIVAETLAAMDPRFPPGPDQLPDWLVVE